MIGRARLLASGEQFVGPRLNLPATRVKGAERTPLFVAGNIKRMRTSDRRRPCRRFRFQLPRLRRGVYCGIAQSAADPPPRRIGEFPEALTPHADPPCN